MAQNRSNIIDREISNFFNVDYKIYVQYVIEQRAIPSIIDGMKPSYRKVLYSCLESMKSGSVVPGLELVGETYKRSAYHHGNASLEDVIVGSASNYDNNASPLKVHGSGGSLRNPSASAIRYLKFSLDTMADMFKLDSDILEHNFDGDKRIEPKFYLPLVPLVLAKRTGAPAIGYAFSNDMSYSLPSLADACLQQIKNIEDGKEYTGKLPDLIPYVHGFNGIYRQLENHRWATQSRWSVEKNKVIVEDLPMTMSFDKFKKNLATLLDKGIILNFDNKTVKGDVKYIIHFNQTALAEHVKKNRLEKLLMLSDSTKTPGLNVINELGKIETKLMTPHDVVRYFTGYRLKRYDDRKTLLIKKIDERIAWATDLQRFIKLVIDGKLELRNVPIVEVKKRLDIEKINHEVLQTRVAKMTKEEYEDLLKEIEELKKERIYVLETPITTMYRNDLNELKKKTAWQKNECQIIKYVPPVILES